GGFDVPLARAEEEQSEIATDFAARRAGGEISKWDPPHAVRRGEPAAAFDRAATRIKAEYRMPVEHHNPMEPFAATAVWDGDGRITVFDKTQGPQNCRNYVAGVFEMPRDKVRVLSPYVRGGVRSGLRPPYEFPLALLAPLALPPPLPVTPTPPP